MVVSRSRAIRCGASPESERSENLGDDQPIRLSEKRSLSRLSRLDGRFLRLVVGTIEHPQSRVSDLYRELGDLFGVLFPCENRPNIMIVIYDQDPPTLSRP